MPKEKTVTKSISIRPSLIKRIEKFPITVQGVEVRHLSFSDRLQILVEVGLSHGDIDLRETCREMYDVLQQANQTSKLRNSLGVSKSDWAKWEEAISSAGG